jgi:hypothetical protein
MFLDGRRKVDEDVATAAAGPATTVVATTIAHTAAAAVTRTAPRSGAWRHGASRALSTNQPSPAGTTPRSAA